MRRRNALRALSVLGLVLVAGCSDLLGIAGLSRLDGYWVGSYDADFDFYLDLDDDWRGLYGTAGITTGSGASDIYVDGERSGGEVRFYSSDLDYGDGLIFEGRVTGSDRIDGIAYLDVIPRPVTLHRR
ncbi:MAG: hypothetical protein ACJ8GN_25365 [Longimicrobiaceae bacterium]